MVKLNRNRQPIEDEPSYEIDIPEDDEEEEDYDEEDEEEYEDDDRKKKIIIIGAVVATLIVGAIGFRALTGSNQSKPSTPSTQQVKKTKKTTSSTKKEKATKESKTEETTQTSESVDIRQEAKDTLERPNAPTTDAEKEAIATHMTSTIDKAVQALPDIKNDQESGMFLTSNTMLNMVAMALSMGYRPDMTTLQTYKSDNENVHQFTIDFKKDDRFVTFTGNYAPAIEQLEFAQIHGTLPVESASTEKQVDKEKAKAESDTPVHPDAVDDGGES